MERQSTSLDALGFTSSGERWPELIGYLWDEGARYGEGGLDVRCWRDSSGVNAWFARNPDGEIDGVAFGLEAEPGVYAILSVGPRGGTAHAWIFPHDGGEALYPVLVQSPQFWFSKAVAKENVRGWASLVMTAQTGRLFSSEEEMQADEELSEYASKCFIPTGLLVEETEEARPEAFLKGRIVAARRATNGLCSSRFHILRVDTLGGEITVALADEPGLQIALGDWIAATGVMFGITPKLFEDITPLAERAADPTNGGPWLERLRGLCTGYFNSDEFTGYFEGLHVDPKLAGVIKTLGWVIPGRGKDMRTAPARMGLATPELRQRYQNMAADAPFVPAPVVMANSELTQGGKSAPALVLVCTDIERTGDLLRVNGDFKRILFGYPENELEKALQDEFEDETYIFGRRRRLPREIAGDLEVYAADLQLDRRAMGSDGLIGDVILCLAEPGPEGISIAVPDFLIDRARNPQSTPPPLPHPGE
jgi:hypothetical protein